MWLIEFYKGPFEFISVKLHFENILKTKVFTHEFCEFLWISTNGSEGLQSEISAANIFDMKCKNACDVMQVTEDSLKFG